MSHEQEYNNNGKSRHGCDYIKRFKEMWDDGRWKKKSSNDVKYCWEYAYIFYTVIHIVFVIIIHCAASLDKTPDKMRIEQTEKTVWNNENGKMRTVNDRKVDTLLLYLNNPLSWANNMNSPAIMLSKAIESLFSFASKQMHLI